MALCLACTEVGALSVDQQHGVQGLLHPAYPRGARVPAGSWDLRAQVFCCSDAPGAEAINAWTAAARGPIAVVGCDPWREFWAGEDPTCAAGGGRTAAGASAAAAGSTFVHHPAPAHRAVLISFPRREHYDGIGATAKGTGSLHNPLLRRSFRPLVTALGGRMATAAEVVRYLQSAGMIAVDQAERSELARVPVTGIATDSDASEGDLAWVSAKRLAADPDAVSRYRGSLLICPDTVKTVADARVVLCAQPKIAFIRAVREFFPDLDGIGWPSGAVVVSADAEIGRGVVLAAGVVVGPSVILGDAVSVGPNTCIANAEVAAGVRIGANCSIGLPGFGYDADAEGTYWRFPHVGRVIIEEGVEIGSNTCIDRGSLGATVIRRGAKIDNLVHVAHNVVVGRNTLVIANSMLGGSAELADGVWVAPSVSLMNQAKVGAGAVLGMGAVVLKDVADGATMVGNPARKLEKKGS